MKYMYITNRVEIAKIAERHTVDRIFVDLETRGKHLRQAHVNSVKSEHTMRDISAIRGVLSSAGLLVRINPGYSGTKDEIDEAVARGADLLMLPMFRTADDASRFVELVGGRAKTVLLVETVEAERNIREIAAVPGVDEIHIGLNDLHLAHGMRFMFELLANGTVDRLCGAIREAGIPYGFGGVGRLDGGTIPGRYILAEHYRLGSDRAILSRSFFDSSTTAELEAAERAFRVGMCEIRAAEQEFAAGTDAFFAENHALVRDLVAQTAGICIG